jgi:hypothetical protein
MAGSTLVPLDSHALATLRYIRSTINTAGSVPVPGSAGLTSGMIGLLAAILASGAALQTYWVWVWIVAALIAAPTGAALVARQSARNGFTLLGTPVRKVLLCLLPCLFAGGVLTVLDLQLGSRHAIAGTWLLLYGCGLISISAVTCRTIGYLGACFALLGCTAFLVPAEYHMTLLGTGFGGLHMLYGLLARREEGHALAR